MMSPLHALIDSIGDIVESIRRPAMGGRYPAITIRLLPLGFEQRFHEIRAGAGTPRAEQINHVIHTVTSCGINHRTGELRGVALPLRDLVFFGGRYVHG